MHAKTDSEVTSIVSSPTRSPPRQPAYYVQSPSHDGEKTATSIHSTPVLSPSHSHSSSTRFSGSRKINPTHAAAKKGTDFDVIEEEGLLYHDGDHKFMSRRCYVLAFVFGFFVLFSLFSLILWGASRPQKPKIIVKRIKFDRFIVSAGSDSTGVATEMASVNSTLKFLYRNTATFFGVHVTSSPLDLSYSKIRVATGNVKKFYQARKSQRALDVPIFSDKVPLYGSGQSLVGTSSGIPTTPVNMTLKFTVRSRAYVLGSLVKPKFYKVVECAVSLDPKKINSAISLKNKCTYQ